MSSPIQSKPAAHANRVDSVPMAELRGFSIRLLQETNSILDAGWNGQDLHRELLNAALKHAACVGAAWYRLQDGRVVADVELLEHPALQHASIRTAVKDQAQVAAQQRRELAVPHPVVRNLVQTSVPMVIAEQTQVIVLLSVVHDQQPRDHALFTAHCLIQAKLRRVQQLDLQTTRGQLNTTAALLELTEQLVSQTSLNGAQRVLADRLNEHLGSRFVAVGWKRKSGVTCRVESVSDLSSFDRNSERSRRLKTALDEAMLRDKFAAWPAVSDAQNHQILGLRQLAEHQQVEVVLSTPLRCRDGEIVGAVVVGGGSELLLEASSGLVRTLDSSAGTALRAVQKAEGSILRRCFKSVLQTKRPVMLTLAVVLAVVTAVMLLQSPYRVACSFRCESVQSHFTVAPFDGLIEQTYVRPGDEVDAGQLIATMDGRELRIELAGLMADSSRADRQRDVHLAEENVADSIIAGLEVERLNSRQDLLNDRLMQLELRSPVAGVVLSGSLERKEHYPVEIGQKLYEVAQLSTVRIDVAVPEEDIDHVRIEMSVSFRPDSMPGKVIRGRIDRIRPRSETVQERNVFIAEVVLDNTNGTLCPGMEGLATIESDPHRIGWNLFHKPWEYTTSRLLW